MPKEYSNTSRELDIKELIHQISFLIINKEDYKEAAKIVVENNLSIEKLYENTVKLTSTHCAKLTDEILQIK